MRSSARSAVSIDARDSLQPVDHAGRAAMAHEGMLQLGLVVEAIWPTAGCTRPVTQTARDGPITRRDTLPPPPSPSNPLRHPLTRCGSPPPPPVARTRTETQGWPGSGVRTPTPPPTLPPQPEHTLLAGQGSRRSGGGRGVGTRAPGLGNGRGGLPIPASGGTPPMHIGAGRRSFRRAQATPPGSPSLGGRPRPSPSLDQGRLGASWGRASEGSASILS